MLRAENITVRYENRIAVENVSMTLGQGEVIAILGANGAGKTTFMRALNGSVPVSEGQVLLEGKAIENMSRREIARRIAVVAQENETRFPISVLDFVLSGRFVHGRAFGWETADDLQFARSALSECDLDGFEYRWMNHLSGGERQRVVLARALAAGTRILLLDEPTANLDIAHQAMMFRLVRNRCERCGSAAIVITHDLNLAAEFADRIILLDSGRAAAVGSPAEVLTAENIKRIFCVDALLDLNPVSSKVRVTPIF